MHQGSGIEPNGQRRNLPNERARAGSRQQARHDVDAFPHAAPGTGYRRLGSPERRCAALAPLTRTYALAAAREDRGLVRVAGRAPRHDLVERAAAAHADVVVVEAAVAHAWGGERIRWHGAHAPAMIPLRG